MKMLKVFLLVFLGVLLVFVTIGLSLDPVYKISRSRLIDANKETVWYHLKDFKNWPKWSPWIQADSTMKVSFSEQSQGVGATMFWVSEHSGEGSQVITSYVEEQSLDTELSFGKKGKATSRWQVESKGNNQDQTLVTWSFSGDMGNDIIGRYMGLLMDRFMGAFFEKGLENLEKAAQLNSNKVEVNEVTDDL